MFAHASQMFDFYEDIFSTLPSTIDQSILCFYIPQILKLRLCLSSVSVSFSATKILNCFKQTVTISVEVTEWDCHTILDVAHFGDNSKQKLLKILDTFLFKTTQGLLGNQTTSFLI